MGGSCLTEVEPNKTGAGLAEPKLDVWLLLLLLLLVEDEPKPNLGASEEFEEFYENE